MTCISHKSATLLPLNLLKIADENLRAAEEADTAIGELADSLSPDAAGQLLPMFVRPADDEGVYGVLDGRRRFLAFTTLAANGVIPENHPIACIVCETDAEVSQAVIAANAQRQEIHLANVLLTINKLLSERHGIDDMAKALGKSSRDIKKLVILGQLDPRILNAFRDRRISLKNLRQLARLKDQDRITAFIEAIEDSDGQIHDHFVREFIDESTFVTHAVLRAFPLEAYTAKGGEVEQDLFDEHPDRVLNPDLLGGLWMAAMKPVMKAIKVSGIRVNFKLVHDHTEPTGATELGWNFPSTADTEKLARLQSEHQSLGMAIQTFEPGNPTAFVDLCREHALKALEVFTEKARPLVPTTCKMSCNMSTGAVKISFFVDETQYDDLMARHEAERPRPNYAVRPLQRVDSTPLPETNLSPDVSLYGHSHHLKTTTIAGRALARSLAETPMVALDVQLSAQFQQSVLKRTSCATHYVLKICAGNRVPCDPVPDDHIDAPILERLKAYQDEYMASGSHPFTWVSTLDPSRKLDLLALITALQVDMGEMRTDTIRRDARSEAILISQAIGHDTRNYVTATPDDYAQYSKKALLTLVTKMGLDPDEYADQKRRQLAEAVYDLAQQRNYLPDAYNYNIEDYTMIDEAGAANGSEDDDGIEAEPDNDFAVAAE